MSKKMWNKIFKSKSSKNNKTLSINANKINKRCSIYEEYQQLNATGNAVDNKKKQQQNSKSPNLNYNENASPAAVAAAAAIIKTVTTTNDELPLPAIVAAGTATCMSTSSNNNIHTQQQQKSLSTFSKVVNTLTLKRHSKEQHKDASSNILKNNNNNNKKQNNKAHKSAAAAVAKNHNNAHDNGNTTTTTTTATTTTSNSELFSHVNTPRSMLLIVVNKLVCDTRNVAAIGDVACNQHCSNSAVVDHHDVQLTITNATNTATNLHVIKKNTQSYLNNNINDIIETNEEPNTNVSLELTPCPICSRTFNPVTLQKHVGICEKMATKKRNIFDSSRQRREGTELASYPLPKGFGLPPTRQDRGQSPKPTQVSSPVLTRKKPSEDLARTTARSSMRKLTTSNTTLTSTVPTPETNTSLSGGGHTSTTVAASSPSNQAVATHSNSNFSRDRMRSSERALGKRSIQPPAAEQCPHCERCFGVKAYDRHVEWCKEKALQASIKHPTKNEQNVAKERLEARTKYRAPCLKTKRSINRDKYSGLTGDDNDSNDSPKSGSSNANNNNNNIMSLSMTSSIMSDTTLQNHGNITNGAHNHSNNHKKGSNNNNRNTTNCHYDDMPIPTNANRDVHYSNSELDMKSFHLIGEKCTTTSMPSNKRKDTAAVERVVVDRNKYDLNKDLVKGIPFIAPRRTKSNTSIQNDRPIGKKQQDQQKEIHADDTNDLLTTLTLFSSAAAAATTTTTTETPTLTSTKSSTSLNRRKLKTKQKSAINFIIPTMQNFEMENLDVGAGVGVDANDSAGMDGISTTAAVVTTDFVTNNKINKTNNKLRNAKSLPQMQLTQQHQQQEQDESIFEMPTTTTTTATTKKSSTTTTTKNTASISPTIMLTKLETNPIKSPAICRPKRKKLQRQQSITSTPLKATIPLLKESIEAFGLLPGNKKSNNFNVTDLSCDNNEIRVIKAPPPSLKGKAPSPPPPTLTRNKSFILSGLSDSKYDPFLSAKRQLEDLCSPISSTTYTVTPKTPNTPNTPIAPQTTPSTPMPMHLNPKMTSSLYITSSNASPPLLTPTCLMNRSINLSAMNATNKSNFRRTASLRGPRRSPMLPSRPLFTQQQRPTIQRGLSDEGPISNNFLKPEEYDEMPVRSVCVNDYAITKSPRVVRRDTSASNRKHNLKLNINPAAVAAIPNDPQRSADCISTASKYLSKTDSLAAFLKYENELEKLPSVKADIELVDKTANVVQRSLPSTPAVVTQSRDSPLITKELKDKSNALSKQNSAKNIIAEAQESLKRADIAEAQVVSTNNIPTRLPTPIVSNPQHVLDKSSNSNEQLNHNNKLGQIRLEPISKPGTPINKSNTPNAYTKPTTASLPKATNPNAERSMQLPAITPAAAINLNTIFGDAKPKINGASHFQAKERKISSSSNEFIDPKLINKCDNLPVGVEAGRAVKKPMNSEASAKRSECSNSSASSAENTVVPAPLPTYTPTPPISKISMLLPLQYKEEDVEEKAPPPQTNSKPQSHHTSNGSTTPRCAAAPTSSQRSSYEGRNLLKRKIRLGRNQFLYDVSPDDADCCSADDEGNRSSMEFDDDHNTTTAFNANQYRSNAQPPTATAATFIPPPTIPPLPIFDDFDFEEFLSSFENDDDQFPLFKDCREFLMNRASNKQRSTVTSSSNNTKKSNDSNNENTKNLTYQQFTQNPTQPPFTHFPFESVINRRFTNSLLTSPSMHNSTTATPPASSASKEETSKDLTSSKYTELKSTISSENFANESEDKKREIFISIETEQNDLGHSPISPDMLRNLVTSGVGNHSRAHVEEVCDATDNKFSKIGDDEPVVPTESASLSSSRSFFNSTQYPNIQLNNAKNLIQKMQDDFRQMGEEVGANIRQAVIKNTQGNAEVFAEQNQRSPSVSARSERVNDNTFSATMMPSGDANADSDDMSSLDSYPMSSQSSRRGVASKLSADSAYGSLSRQRSTELATHRSLNRTRPSTANSVTNTTQTAAAPMIDAATQHYHQQQQQQLQQQQHSNYKYATMKNRSRQYNAGGAISSSSGSDNSLPPIGKHNNLTSNNAQQQQLLLNQNTNNNNRYQQQQQHSSATIYDNAGMNNNIPFESPLSSPTATNVTATATGALSSSTPSMTGSMKMSKFCHECGAKFIIEQAKFCMDCGVRRIVL